MIGGSAVGPKDAARALRSDEEAEITIVKDPDLSIASCGYPYYVGGFFDDRKQLICAPTGVIWDPGYFMKVKGIRVRCVRDEGTLFREAVVRANPVGLEITGRKPDGS